MGVRHPKVEMPEHVDMLTQIRRVLKHDAVRARALLESLDFTGMTAPERAAAHRLLGLSYYHLGSFLDARVQLESAVSEARDHAPDELSVSLCALGRVWIQLGRNDEAVAAFQQGLAASTNSLAEFEARDGLGRVELALGNGAQAAAHYRACLDLGLTGPDYRALTWCNLAAALTLSGELEAAEAAARSSEHVFATENPDGRARPSNLCNLGTILIHRGEIEQGMVFLEQCQAMLDPEGRRLTLLRCLCGGGEALLDAGEPEEARRLLLRASLLCDETLVQLRLDVLVVLARCEAELGHWQEAWEREREAHQLTRQLNVDTMQRRITDVEARLQFEIDRVRSVELTRANNELSAANEALQLANAESAKLAASRQEMLWVLSHELRTPLSGVVGVAGLLAMEELTREQRELVEVIRASANHTLAVANDALELERLDGALVDKAPVQLPSLLSETARFVAQTAVERQLTLDVLIDEGAPHEVVCDDRRIRQVALNLLGNALKHTDRGGVVVALCPHPTGARIEVRDTGGGVTEEQAQRLFDPFVQLERTQTGAGLGLALSKTIVERHGGEIGVDSVPGEGSTFWFTLPASGGCTTRRAAARITDGEALPAPVLEPSSRQGLPRRTVLVVDDEPTNLFVTTRMLERLGQDVLVAQTVQEALEMGPRADLGILDLHIGDELGTELARQLIAGGFEGPLVALSASLAPHDRAEAEASGMVDYLVKPATMATLARVLEALLDPALA